MSCPDCKDGFYYPLVGPREPCQTCSSKPIAVDFETMSTDCYAASRLTVYVASSKDTIVGVFSNKDEADDGFVARMLEGKRTFIKNLGIDSGLGKSIQAENRIHRSKQGNGPNPQNTSRQQAKNAIFAEAYEHPTATEINDAKRRQTPEERDAILRRIGVKPDGFTPDGIPQEVKTTDWKQYLPGKLKPRANLLKDKTLSDEDDHHPSIIKLIVTSFVKLRTYDLRRFLTIMGSEINLAQMADFTSYSQERKIKGVSKKALRDNGFDPSL